MEANNTHFFDLKRSAELENAFQERQRMESHLRLGNVPAHIAHPIAAAVMGGVRRGRWENMNNMGVDAGVDDGMGVADTDREESHR